jgi:hypothetical protein
MLIINGKCFPKCLANIMWSMFTSIRDFTDFPTLGPITNNCSSCDSHKVFCSSLKFFYDSGIWLIIFLKATRITWFCFVRIANYISRQFTILWIFRWSPPGYCQLVFFALCERHILWSSTRYWIKRKTWCHSLQSAFQNLRHFGHKTSLSYMWQWLKPIVLMTRNELI